MRLAETRLAGLAPTAPRTVAEAIAALKGELPQGEVRRQLEAALAVGELRLGARAVAIEIADGIARLAPITVETADGRVTGTTVVDLATLKVDSEWRLDPLPLPAERRLQRPPVPGIVLVYTGDLARPDALTRGLQLDGYERELIVRKYERDVEELERVRRDDEERVRQEAERRRLEDVERQPRPPENDGATPARPAEPQKQTGLDPPRLVVGELLLPPKLPPLSLLPLRPEARAKLPETDEPATAPAAPATTAGSIPASAETTPRSEPRSELPRPATAPAPAPRPKRDVFRDISRDSP